MAHYVVASSTDLLIGLLLGSVLVVASSAFITLSYAHTLVGQAIKLGITAPPQLFKILPNDKKCLSETEKV